MRLASSSRFVRIVSFIAMIALLLPLASAARPSQASGVLYTLTAPQAAKTDNGLSVVALGDFYMFGKERYELLRRTDQVVVQFAGNAQSAITRLTSSGAALAGFSQVRFFGDNLYAFENATLANADNPTRSYDRLTDTLNRVQRDASVRGAAPVFIVADLGSYAVATDEVIVRLQEGVSPASFFNDSRFSSYRQADSADYFIATASAGFGQAALELAANLQNDPRLKWAEPNFYQEIEKFYTPNDPLFPLQWHLENTGQGFGIPGSDVNLPAAWDYLGGGGDDIVIAVLDDGIELAHPDLLIYNNPNETLNGVDSDDNGYVDDTQGWDFTSGGVPVGDNNPGWSVANDRHGTAVAGVAAARGDNGIGVAGAAYNARVLPVRIFLGPTATNQANIGSALGYAAGRARAPGATNWEGASIANNSWGGGGPSAAINENLQWGTDNGRGGLGTIYMFATGNDGPVAISLPASLSGTIGGVIAVGASNNFDLRSSYSQFGPQLDFVTSSNGGTRGIVTADRLGAAGYNGLPDNNYTNLFGGTSSATPLASGVAALLLSVDPTLTVTEVRTIMRGTANKIGSLAYDANGRNLDMVRAESTRRRRFERSMKRGYASLGRPAKCLTTTLSRLRSSLTNPPRLISICSVLGNSIWISRR